jgi:MFS family permease
MTQVIFSDMIPLRQRPKYFAMVLGAWAVGMNFYLVPCSSFLTQTTGSILGPVTGGFFVQYLTWRWVFYFNFPFCAAGFVMIPLFVKLNAISDSSLTQKIRRIDWLGSLLFLGSTTSFLIGISWAGVQYAWLSVQSLMPIIIGTLGIGVSLYWETIATQPILRLALFNNVSAMAAYYCAFAQGFIVSPLQNQSNEYFTQSKIVIHGFIVSKYIYIYIYISSNFLNHHRI